MWCAADTHLVTQCAAVRTHWVPMRAPPQRYWLSELISATCQHHSAGSPSSPPTTRPCLSRLRTVPFTPHTYLLYTGGRGVVELAAGEPGVKTSAIVQQNAILHFVDCLKLSYTPWSVPYTHTHSHGFTFTHNIHKLRWHIYINFVHTQSTN